MKIACPKCGADIKYDPEKGKVYCNHCNTFSSIEEIDLKQFKNHIEDEQNNKEVIYDEINCSSCGAKLITDKATTITICAFCGSQQLIRQRLTGRFEPKKIIPFKLSQEEFIKKYHESIKKRIFAPSSFKNNYSITEVKGLYVPYYIYDADLSIYGRGKASNNSDSNNKTKWFEYQHTETISMPIDASLKLNDDFMTYLEPFDFYDLTSFNPAYITGFQAECVDEDKNSIYEKVNKKLNFRPFFAIQNHLQNYKQTAGLSIYDIKKENLDYILLPVWFMNTKYKGKMYSYAINGQTGKVAGEIPISFIKYSAFIVMILFILVRNSCHVHSILL